MPEQPLSLKQQIAVLELLDACLLMAAENKTQPTFDVWAFWTSVNNFEDAFDAFVPDIVDWITTEGERDGDNNPLQYLLEKLRDARDLESHPLTDPITGQLRELGRAVKVEETEVVA